MNSPDDNAMHILNDLERAQNDIVRVQSDIEGGSNKMVELLTQLVENTQGNQNNAANDGSRGTNGSHGHNGNHVEGINTHVPTQNHIGSTSRVTPRPHMPQFLEGQQDGNQGKQGQGEYFTDYLREYQTLGDDFRNSMSLQDFCTIKYKNRPRDFNRGPQSWELQQKVGKLSIPYFDGSRKCTARAWVQKLDTYFQLNPMTKSEAIKYATLHLDGEAHEWWYHGLVTLGHAVLHHTWTSHRDLWTI
jgi:hypothetical protein